MHDIVIRNATVVDGTGADRFTGDVAVSAGRFQEVGGKLGPARREIDAEGLLLTPGWVDIHTHYDGQATWDPYLTPSSWHGVTTAVFGNCSVGFAPVRRGSEHYLINLMEGVEDIPETVLAEGIDFTWESFPEYLDALERMPHVMDIGAQMPHSALRFYVMGPRGADHAEQPTAEEISEMGRLLKQALAAGALGFTTSRTLKHRAADGRSVPSLSAREAELFGLAEAMAEAGTGVIEVNSDLFENDFAILRRAAEIAGRPLSLLLIQIDAQPGLWRETLDNIADAVASGMHVNGQVGTRGIGMLIGLESTVNPFERHPAWQALANLSPEQRLARIAADGELQRRLVEDLPDDKHSKWMRRILERTFELGDAVDYEPVPENSVAALARAQNRDPFAVALEMMLKDGGWAQLLHPFENYTGGDLEVVREMLCHPHTVCGIADAGAHVGTIADASAPTYLLTHWARDRRRGEKLPLEFAVHKQTQATAESYGLLDRGVVKAGYRADFNLIDWDNLRLEKPHLVYDLPAGGKRHAAEGDWPRVDEIGPQL